MRDQFAGDISDLFKFSLLCALAATDRKLGIGWYFIQGHNNRNDGRHREFCNEPKWKALDKEVWKALKNLPERSVGALEKLRFWPDGVEFYKGQIEIGRRRNHWFEAMRDRLAECNLVFLDPDNGLGRMGILHATLDEIMRMRQKGRCIVLIKFPGHVKRDQQIKSYHKQLFETASAESILTITTSVMIGGQPRIRWFTIMDGIGELETRAKKYADKLNSIKGCKAICFKGEKPRGHWNSSSTSSNIDTRG